MDNIIPHGILTPGDLESLRWLRNESSATMRDRQQITWEQQREWWALVDHDKLKVWLYRVDHNEVGYGLIRLIDGKWWVTVAVAPTERGKGYGKDIHKHLAAACPTDLWAEQLTTNVGAYKSATAAGFVAVGSREVVGLFPEYTILVHFKEGATP